ncbi:hypothetical protein HK100_000648 [Physocladia obscura]|uniref:Uncharacterized protein n=1 Tax=Physocladia obscura TaxID=109957 RepID=A0AAD5XGH7_9FUNG|nr:hypothetical protein HK100_000648 [Physocladia obscura]
MKSKMQSRRCAKLTLILLFLTGCSPLLIIFFLVFTTVPTLKKPPLPQICNSSANCNLPLLWAPPENSTRTATNAAAIAQSLSFRLYSFDPRTIAPYGMSRLCANRIVESGHVKFLCSSFDVIIIADTLPHGRPFLQYLASGKHCKARVIIELTNRFNWEIKDSREYNKIVTRLISKNRVRVISNNRVEYAFLESTINYKIPLSFSSLSLEQQRQQTILRPLGIGPADTTWPQQYGSQNISHFVSRANFCGRVYTSLQEQHEFPLVIIPAAKMYGGSTNLAQFKAFIDFPYQYSVMKFYENIAFGVVQYIPTPRLWEEVLKTKLHCAWWASPSVLKNLSSQSTKLKTNTTITAIAGFPDWSAYMDYYDPLFEPYVYYFDSIDELLRLKEMTPGQVDWKNVRVNGPRFYEEYRVQILEGWKDLLLGG